MALSVLISLIDADDLEVQQSAEILAREFAARGCKAIVDDRKISADAKLAEPTVPEQPRLLLGERWLVQGDVELRGRGTTLRVKLEDVVDEAMRFFK